MQPGGNDSYLARYIVEKGLVSREALLGCLFELAHRRRADPQAQCLRPLGAALVSRGLLSEGDLKKILLADRGGAPQTSPSFDEDGRTQFQASRPTDSDEERDGNGGPASAELPLASGLAKEETQRPEPSLGPAEFVCSGCGQKKSLALPRPGIRYRCKRCGGVLSVVVAAEWAEGSGMQTLPDPSRNEEELEFEIDRAVALYLKQKGMARRDQLREAQRLKAELSRYGLVVPLLEVLRRTAALSWQQWRALKQVDFRQLIQEPHWKDQTLPGYKLMDRISSGGFATIFAAKPLFGEGRLAVKILHPERAKDPRAIARFQREVHLLLRFNSPYIVRGIEGGSYHGRPYVVMEYLEGRSLGQVISEAGSFPLREALQVTRQVAEALRYLHGEGYLHRDVKPDNALIDAGGRVKLCDLGFASPIPAAALEGARVATAVGTAGYMSPEVARGEADVKVGSDIYSLGVLLYALLTGHEPFSGASSEEVVADQVESAAPIPNLLMVEAGPHVVQFLKRTLHPDRTRRFGAVVDIIRELDLLLGTEAHGR